MAGNSPAANPGPCNAYAFYSEFSAPLSPARSQLPTARVDRRNPILAAYLVNRHKASKKSPLVTGKSVFRTTSTLYLRASFARCLLHRTNLTSYDCPLTRQFFPDRPQGIRASNFLFLTNAAHGLRTITSAFYGGSNRFFSAPTPF